MPISVRLDVMLALRKVRSKELASASGLTPRASQARLALRNAFTNQSINGSRDAG